MTRIWAAFSLVLWLATAPLLAQNPKGGAKNLICNEGGSVCVNSSLRNSMVEIPLYFAVQIKCPDEVTVAWELRDDSGKVLDQDLEGRLAFLVTRISSIERTLAVRDFFLLPAKSDHGQLILHSTTCGDQKTLPDLSIPVKIDLRTSDVIYAVPANDEEFDAEVDDYVESGTTRHPIRSKVNWRTKSVLHVRSGMTGGAAAETVARDNPGQSSWHVIDYRRVGSTVHLTTFGDGWAGVTYYLVPLDYLIEKTVEHQPGVRHIAFDQPPDFGQ
jgi:hypothetical protein